MLLLIDGDYLLARMLHTPALWMLTAEIDYFRPEGDKLVPRRGVMHTGGVYGAIKALMGALGRFPISKALLVFGKGRSPRRLALYEDYKGTISKTKVVRTPQEELAHTEYQQAQFDNRSYLTMLLPALGVRVCDAPYEADDVICYMARRCQDEGQLSVIVMSDDKDMLTLVSQGVSVFRPIADQHVHALNYQEMVGIQGPAQYLLAKAMMGDTSDCIPGVPQVGEKTAKSLAARTNGTIESLFNAAEKSTSKREKYILDHRAIVERNLKLMDMDQETFGEDTDRYLSHLLSQPAQVYVSKVVEHLGRLQCHALLAEANQWLLLFQRLS